MEYRELLLDGKKIRISIAINVPVKLDKIVSARAQVSINLYPDKPFFERMK